MLPRFVKTGRWLVQKQFSKRTVMSIRRCSNCSRSFATTIGAHPLNRKQPLPAMYQRRNIVTPQGLGVLRNFGISSEDDIKRRLDEINDKFVEARDEIEYALEEEGTVYFEEEVEMVSSSTQGSKSKSRTLFIVLFVFVL